MEPKDCLIVPLDVKSPSAALALIDELSLYVGKFKVGLELLMSILSYVAFSHGEGAVTEVRRLFSELRGRVFFDGKFHDIPNTVGGAADAIRMFEAWAFDVHASGGSEAIVAAAAVKHEANLLAVTVLTSLNSTQCMSIFGGTPTAKVEQFAQLAQKAGADGVVCSPGEIGAVRSACGDDFLVVTPGVRPAWASSNDQKRVMTPAEAVKEGASHLVIGRPITNPPAEVGTPADAVRRILDEIATAT